MLGYISMRPYIQHGSKPKSLTKRLGRQCIRVLKTTTVILNPRYKTLVLRETAYVIYGESSLVDAVPVGTAVNFTHGRRRPCGYYCQLAQAA